MGTMPYGVMKCFETLAGGITLIPCSPSGPHLHFIRVCMEDIEHFQRFHFSMEDFKSF